MTLFLQKKVASWLPKTTWVCCGDSTQSDPEAYAEFYQQLVQLNQGGRIARIFIRKVVGVNPKLEATLNAPERFEKAFARVPKSVWKVFEDGKELMDEVEKLKVERKASDNRPISTANHYVPPHSNNPGNPSSSLGYLPSLVGGTSMMSQGMPGF
jgi:hypothetical protein